MFSLFEHKVYSRVSWAIWVSGLGKTTLLQFRSSSYQGAASLSPYLGSTVDTFARFLNIAIAIMVSRLRCVEFQSRGTLSRAHSKSPKQEQNSNNSEGYICRESRDRCYETMTLPRLGYRVVPYILPLKVFLPHESQVRSRVYPMSWTHERPRMLPDIACIVKSSGKEDESQERLRSISPSPIGTERS
jgi:hypothetical protein